MIQYWVNNRKFWLFLLYCLNNQAQILTSAIFLICIFVGVVIQISNLYDTKSRRAITHHLLIQSGHANTVTSVAFSHDGQLLASANYDGSVKVWDAASGTLKFTLEDSSKGLEVRLAYLWKV
jgi:WD40 repeat protein